MDEEIKSFEDGLTARNLSKNTIHQYIKYLSAYAKHYGTLPDGEQNEIYKNIEDLQLIKKNKTPQKSTKAQTLKAVCAYRNFKGLSNTELVKMYADVNRTADADAKKRNEELNEKLPSLSEHNKWVEELYDMNDAEKLRAYVINRLILNCYVRNQDLVADIITKVGQLEKQPADKNYLYINKNQLTYGRRDYKTAKSYGEKVDVPAEKGHRIKMIKALRVVLKNSPNGNLIPEKEMKNLSNYIQEQTNGLGETKLLKMSLKEKNNLANAVKIGKSRGTSVSTLQKHYNLVE